MRFVISLRGIGWLPTMAWSCSLEFIGAESAGLSARLVPPLFFAPPDAFFAPPPPAPPPPLEPPPDFFAADFDADFAEDFFAAPFFAPDDFFAVGIASPGDGSRAVKEIGGF